MRHVFGLLVLSGPEELVDLAKRVRKADMELHAHRWELDPGGSLGSGLPPKVLTAVRQFDDALEEFAREARKHVS